jgi:hypothetical protein
LLIHRTIEFCADSSITLEVMDHFVNKGVFWPNGQTTGVR